MKTLSLGLGFSFYYFSSMKNLRKIVTWLTAFALIGVISYSLSLLYWTVGIIFALSSVLIILIKLPRDDN